MAKEIINQICMDQGINSDGLESKVIKNNIILVKKFNWPYLEALKFQEACVDYVYQNPKISIFIATNHPTCLTLGRGLQKKIGDETELIDFSDQQRSQIQVPVFDIKRGGGVTFHHPGQLVIYPIVNLTHKKLKVYTLMSHLLRELSSGIKSTLGEKSFDYCRDLLGLWSDQYKIASIGLQVRRFVTFHGVALNVSDNPEIEQTLRVIYPCGLSGSVYKSLSSLYNKNLSEIDLTNILTAFSKNLENIFKSNDDCSLL